MGFTHLISSFLDFFDGNETTEKDTDLDSELAEQTEFLQGLAELETLEKEVANYTEPEQTVSDKAFCDACGAPLSLVNGCCAYCGTRYGASAAASLPASTLERELLVRQKASEVYDLYEEYALSKQSISNSTASGDILSDLLSTLLGTDTEEAADLIRMSETDLVKGAANAQPAACLWRPCLLCRTTGLSAAPADADKNQKSPLTVLSYCKGAFLMGLQDTANSFHKDRGIKSHPKNTPQGRHPISPKDRAPDDRHQKRRQAIQRMEVLHLHDGQARHGNEKTADNRDFYHHHVRDEASQQ